MKIETMKEARGRNVFFLLFLAVMTAMFAAPLSSLFRFSYGDDTFSYIPLIPLVSAWLLFQRRKVIFSGVTGTAVPGAVLVLIGFVLYAVGSLGGSSWIPADRHSIMAVSAVACFAGGIGLCFGSGALTAALFPLVFLLFMAPFPPVILDPIVQFLQRWSAEASDILFRVSGIPVFRDKFVFSLPGITIEVAKECSGIRSSLSLFLLSLVSGHLYLRTGWAKAVLLVAVIPITIIKNAIRIFTLTTIAVYIDPRILGSVAHRRGGIPIFFLAMVLLGLVLWALKRLERSGKTSLTQGKPVHADPV